MFSSNASCIHIDGIINTVEKIWHSAYIFLTAIYMLAKILIRQISKRNYCNFHVRRRNRRIYIAKTIFKKMQNTKKNKKKKQNTLVTQMQIQVYNKINYVLINKKKYFACKTLPSRWHGVWNTSLLLLLRGLSKTQQCLYQMLLLCGKLMQSLEVTPSKGFQYAQKSTNFLKVNVRS